MDKKKGKKDINTKKGAKPEKNFSAKRLIVCILVIIIILATVVTYSIGAFAASKISLVGTGAIIYCKTTDEVIYEDNADQPYDIASVVKILTCYVALEELGADADVLCDTVTRKCSDVISNALIASDNNSAMYLAKAVSGDTVTFSEKTNELAKEWGCTNTEIGNASGINGLSTASARDVAIIASHVFENELIRKISGTQSYTIPAVKGAKSKDIENSNLFLEGGTFTTTTKQKVRVEKVPGVFCGKTGTSDDSHTTMVVGVDCDGLECYCVILNSTWDYRYSDMKKLISYAFENTSKYVAFKAGESFGMGKAWYGKTNVIEGVAKEDGIINLPEGASGSLVVCTATFDEKLKAPIAKDDKIGTIEVSLADESIRTVDLVAASDLEKGWFLSRFRVTNATTILIFALIFLVIALFILVLVLRSINKKKYAELRRQRLLEAAKRQMITDRDHRDRGWRF